MSRAVLLWFLMASPPPHRAIPTAARSGDDFARPIVIAWDGVDGSNCSFNGSIRGGHDPRRIDLAALPFTIVLCFTFSLGERSAPGYLADRVFLNRQPGTGRRGKIEPGADDVWLSNGADPPDRWPS
jgi:hypothetical protein